MGDISGFGVGSALDKTWNLWGIVQYRLSESVSLNAGYRVDSLKFSEGSGAGKLATDLEFSGPVIGLMFYF
jgi:hypothetical protein